ncbi:hypothetical protein V8F33_002068 [Rhypophila sp. PSN 637]
MIASHLLAVGLFVASTLAAPLEPNSTSRSPEASYWSLRNFHRVCEGSNCDYRFNIAELFENPSDGVVYKKIITACHFVVSGKALGTPGNETDFTSAKCQPENDDKESFRVDGCWYTDGSLYIEVFKDVKTSWPERLLSGVHTYSATFWYLDSELIQGTAPARMSKVFRHESGFSGIQLPKMVRDEVESESDDGYWQIKNMNRHYNAPVKVTSIWFDIILADGTQEYCQVGLIDSDPDTSFSHKPCNPDAPFTVSWGYSAETDGAVMTLCSPTTRKYAVFGWDGINKQQNLGGSGKMPVHTGDC